jgi:hypothetical protein
MLPMLAWLLAWFLTAALNWLDCYGDWKKYISAV